jgi:hypothetical protein
MKINSLSSITALFLLLAAVSGLSCKKSGSNASSGDQAAAGLIDSSAIADNSYDDVLLSAMVVGSDNGIDGSAVTQQTNRVTTYDVKQVTATIAPCAAYTVTPGQPGIFPRTVVVDFGSGCADAFGITRKGVVTYVFSGKLFTAGTTVAATFTNYSINGYGLDGTYTITNNTAQNGVVFSTSLQNGIFSFPNQSQYNYTESRTYTQTLGASTAGYFGDDAYSVTGGSTFSTAGGPSLVSTISTPLTKVFSCPYIGAGVISFTYNSGSGTLDFGNGTCDNSAVLKFGSFSETITLN